MRRPLIFVGDIHLGRSPRRLAASGLNAAELGPAEAWRRVVRYAESHDVQAVVLAGDVVDQDKDRFEAFGHLERGVRRLVEAGVRVLGVAGNHDHVALPRLAERIPDFVLLGEGGAWERVELEGVDLVGWSFPSRHHGADPLVSPGLDVALQGRRPEALTLGVLHADLDAGKSNYAPVARKDLESRLEVAGWFLGHIHSPGRLSEARPIGYLGSLVGLDRGETGRRGPWRVTPTSASALEIDQLPLGPAYWTRVSVDVGQVPSGEGAQDGLHQGVRAAVSRAASADEWLAQSDVVAVGYRVVFEGETDAGGDVRDFMKDRTPADLSFEEGGRTWVMVGMEDATRPRHDLVRLGQEPGPLGRLANLVLDLRARGSAGMPPGVGAAMDGFDPSAWPSDPESAPLPDPLEVTERAALHLLDELWTQLRAPEDR